MDLGGSGELTDWARREVKPEKSRSLLLRKKAHPGPVPFQDQRVQSSQEGKIKSLGKWYRVYLNDKQSVRAMITKADTWMTSLEKSGLPGKYKAWGYQHRVLHTLLWPLLVNEVPIYTVEGLKRKNNTHLRRWLGVP